VTDLDVLALLLHDIDCGCKDYTGVGDEDTSYEHIAQAIMDAGWIRP
jgi:hypothetical protein